MEIFTVYSLVVKIHNKCYWLFVIRYLHPSNAHEEGKKQKQELPTFNFWLLSFTK